MFCPAKEIDTSKGFTMARLETEKKSLLLSEANEVNAWSFPHHGWSWK
jgi:hypothetical protein